MPLYNASDLIGKTLYANRDIPVRLYAEDSAKVIRTIKSGDMVGVVYSWLTPTLNRKTLYWMMQGPNNTYFYVPHVSGYYSENEIRQQGAMSTIEKVEAAKKENESTKSFIERMLKFALIGGIGYALLKTWIQKK